MLAPGDFIGQNKLNKWSRDSPLASDIDPSIENYPHSFEAMKRIYWLKLWKLIFSNVDGQGIILGEMCVG